MNDSEIQKEILELVHAVSRLRGPGGCPWDQEQSHQTLAPYALEEVCELLEALDSNDAAHIKEELGDVLFQVILHSELGRESGQFTLSDVIKNIREKIIRRHPHVFGDVRVNGTEDVLKNWEDIKKQEKGIANASKKSFSIPPALPALAAALKIGDKTQRQGFDWSHIQEVLGKLDEEVAELKEAIALKDPLQIEHELGDVLFSAAQVGQHLKLDPETSLRKTNRRFEQRYFLMLELAEKDQAEWSQLSLAAKESYWQKAKKALKVTKG